MEGSRIDFYWTKILLLCLLPINFDVCESQEERGVRIVDGASPRDGRVEIYRNDKWGTVSTDGWADKEAAVVCALLGFQGPAVSKTLGPVELAMDVPVYSVSCSKGGSSLADCKIETTEPEVIEGASHDYLNGLEYYIHDQNAGVTCEDVIGYPTEELPTAGNDNNLVTIVICIIGGIIAIVVIVLCCFLAYRFINKSSAAKEATAGGNTESMPMYSQQIGRNYADIQQDPANIQEDRAEGRRPPTHEYSQQIRRNYADIQQDPANIQGERADQAGGRRPRTHEYARTIEKEATDTEYAAIPGDQQGIHRVLTEHYTPLNTHEVEAENVYTHPSESNEPHQRVERNNDQICQKLGT